MITEVIFYSHSEIEKSAYLFLKNQYNSFFLATCKQTIQKELVRKVLLYFLLITF